jgi:hypothetical protein
MFENVNTASSEMIFIKGYTVVKQGHYWPSNIPVQAGASQNIAGLQPAVGYIERAFGDYTGDGKGLPVQIRTRADGNENALGTFSKTVNYYRYANPQDPFNGVGTTAVSSFINNRRSVGIDISKEYVELSNNKLKELRENGKLLKKTVHKSIRRISKKEIETYTQKLISELGYKPKEVDFINII